MEVCVAEREGFEPMFSTPKHHSLYLTLKYWNTTRLFYIQEGGEIFPDGGEKLQELPQPNITIDFNIIFFKYLL